MSSSQIVVLLLDLVLIAAAARALGWLVERFGQPAVIGEIAAGILAGPTVLGAHWSGVVFPADIRSYLSAFATVGVASFMFLAGLEIDRAIFSGHRRAVAAVSALAYVLPFGLGCLVAVSVLARHQHGNRAGLVLFLGCALAVTAFPVLARILHDRGLTGSFVGQVSLASAAVDDVLAWSTLAVVIGIAGAGSGHQWRLLLFVPWVVLIWWVGRPVLAKLADSPALGDARTLVFLAFSGTLLFGAFTEWIGLHVIFGAFAFGVIFPRQHRQKVEAGTQLLSAVMLPAFFVVAGLQVDLGSIDRAGAGELAAILAAALAGKLGGTYAGARIGGVTPGDAGALAALMNTRGLTELVILNVGLVIGIIDVQLYSLLVVMALVTTAMTAPLLHLLGRGGRAPGRGSPHAGSPVASGFVR